MSAHPHAALMLEYAKDAAETDKPWERWECRCTRGDERFVRPDWAEWHPASDWDKGDPHPSWNEDWDFRRKQKLLDFWARVYDDGSITRYETRAAAERAESKRGALPTRIVHLREVTE